MQACTERPSRRWSWHNTDTCKTIWTVPSPAAFSGQIEVNQDKEFLYTSEVYSIIIIIAKMFLSKFLCAQFILLLLVTAHPHVWALSFRIKAKKEVRLLLLQHSQPSSTAFHAKLKTFQICVLSYLEKSYQQEAVTNIPCCHLISVMAGCLLCSSL